MSLTMVPRADWGGRGSGYAPVPWSVRSIFAIHHSTGRTLGSRDPEEWLRNIDHYHSGGGHPSITAGFGYNLACGWGSAPQLYEGRGLDRLGAHIAGQNTGAVGLVVLGDYRSGMDVLTNPMRDRIADAWRECSALAGRQLLVRGHGELAQTACPGDQLHAFARRLRAGGWPEGPTTDPAPGQALPFPLPRGYYFGPRSWGDQSVSGYYRRSFRGRIDREWLREWARQLRRRGWSIGLGKTWLNGHGNDGLYGPEYRRLIRAFQLDQGLPVDGLLGIRTWTVAYVNQVT